MSSKLLPSCDGVPFEPLAWREVARSRTGESPQRQEQPGVEERLREMEQVWEERVREARSAGLREGEAAGRERAAAELRAVIERAARGIDEIAGLRARLRRDAESDLVHLSIAIARRILHREIAVDRDAMRGLVMAALQKVQSQEIVRVRVHPDLAPLLRDALRPNPSERPPEILADSSGPPGTLVIETARGNLDASVDTQLQEIARGLADRLGRST